MWSRRHFGAGCIAFSLALAALKAEPEPETAEAVEKRLETVQIFAFGGVGFAGTTSKGEVDYRVVVSQPPEKANALLEKLYRNGNSQARCYALAGFRKINRSRFLQLLPLMKASGSPVIQENGCIVSHVTLAQIASELASGRYDVQAL